MALSKLEEHELAKQQEAMFCVAFPCNPRPFANGVRMYLENGGNIKDEKCRRIIWVLAALAFGQLARIPLRGSFCESEQTPKLNEYMQQVAGDLFNGLCEGTFDIYDDQAKLAIEQLAAAAWDTESLDLCDEYSRQNNIIGH